MVVIVIYVLSSRGLTWTYTLFYLPSNFHRCFHPTSYLSTQQRTLVVLVRLQSLLVFNPTLFHGFSCFSKLYWIFFAFQDNSSETWDFLAPRVWKKHDTKQSDRKNWKEEHQTQGAKRITLFVFLLQSYPGEERIGAVGLETCALLGQQTSPKGKRGWYNRLTFTYEEIFWIIFGHQTSLKREKG